MQATELAVALPCRDGRKHPPLSELLPLDEALAEQLQQKKEQQLDDGRFGLNDPSSPTVKAAGIKTAAIEQSGVADSVYGGQIYISTTARITCRKAFPDWAKVRNSELNRAIANSFSKNIDQTKWFTPRKGSGANVGEIRMMGATRFIAIVFGSDVRIIAVKGTAPNIGKPPQAQSGKPGSGPPATNIGNALKGIK